MLRLRLAACVREEKATYLNAIRFDGTNTPGWLLNIFVNVEQEADVLQYADGLGQLMCATDLPPALINVFRVIVGESGFTHLVSVNLASREDLGKFLDCLETANRKWDRANESDARHELVGSGIFCELFAPEKEVNGD